MVQNLSQNQKSYKGINPLVLKATAMDILASSQRSSEEKSTDINLYNGQIDVFTAKDVAMVGSGLQVKLNSNLENAVKFLKDKAAEVTVNTSDVVSFELAMKHKKAANPFCNASVMDSDKKEEVKRATSEYLFITAA